jgi:hypothetical protein
MEARPTFRSDACDCSAASEAFRTAVRQAIGVYVDSETISQKVEILPDRPTTFSDAFVMRYEELGRETGMSVAECLETTQAGVQGITKSFPIVGRWTSPDGTLLYVAVGGILSPSPTE